MPVDIYHSLSRDVLSYSSVQQDLLSSSRSNFCYSPSASSLRKVLREYLPTSFQVGSGYICPINEKPIFQDLIVIESGHVPLYQEGDFWCIRPEHAKAVVGILSEGSAEDRYGEWVKHGAGIGHAMKKAGNAQGLVTYWVESEDVANRGIGYEYWKSAIAERNIPSFVVWGSAHCFCKHIGLEPAMYEWRAIRNVPSNTSPAIASLLSLICYHLLETNKSAPFRQWFAEHEWRKENARDLMVKQNNYQAKSRVGASLQNGNNHTGESNLVPSGSPSSGLIGQAVANEPVRPEKRRKKQRKSLRKSSKNKPLNKTGQIDEQRLKLKVQDSSNTPVHQAVLSLDPYSLARCYDLRLDFDAKNKEGNSPLHLAAEFNLEEMALALIDYGADLNVRNYIYATPLHTAIENGANEMIEILLEAGAEVEARNNRARTPLHQAAICGNEKAVLMLLDSFADIHARMEKDMLPLHLACWYGQTEIVDVLIAKGADMNATNSDGNTALHFAAFNGQVKVIKQLINYQAETGILNHVGESYTQRINEGYSGEVIRVLE